MNEIIIRGTQKLGIGLIWNTALLLIFTPLIFLFLSLFRKKYYRSLLFLILCLIFASFLFSLSSPPTPSRNQDCSPRHSLPHSSLKIMSYNMRGAGIVDGSQNDWLNGRRERALDLLRSTRPDFVGFQEGEYGSITFLAKSLSYRSYFQRGEEQSGIMYNPQTLKMIDSGVFFLSPTPHKQSLSPNARFHRSCTWGKFTSLSSPTFSFYVFNTHLDPFSELGRMQQTFFLAKQIEKMLPTPSNERVFLTGDFNTVRGGNSHSLLVSGLSDIHQILFSNSNSKDHDERKGLDGLGKWRDVWVGGGNNNSGGDIERCASTTTTFHGFSGLKFSSFYERTLLGTFTSFLHLISPGSFPFPLFPQDLHIDWILQRERENTDMTICDWVGVVTFEGRDGFYPSDHYPVLCTIPLNDSPKK